MKFVAILEKMTDEGIHLNNALDIEKAINGLSKKETGTSIVIEVQPAFDTIVALSVDYVELKKRNF